MSYWPDWSINSRCYWSSVFCYSNNSRVFKCYSDFASLSIYSLVISFAWGRQQVIWYEMKFLITHLQLAAYRWPDKGTSPKPANVTVRVRRKSWNARKHTRDTRGHTLLPPPPSFPACTNDTCRSLALKIVILTKIKRTLCPQGNFRATRGNTRITQETLAHLLQFNQRFHNKGIQ